MNRLRTNVLILLTLNFLASCHSMDRKDDKNALPLKIPGGSGMVTRYALTQGTLEINDEKTDFPLDTPLVRKSLERVKFYKAQYYLKPHGPVFTLTLMDNNKSLVCWVGDRIGKGSGTVGFTVLQAGDSDHVLLTSGTESWLIPVKEETKIFWQDEDYLVYVSRISINNCPDLPPFEADIIIVKL